MELWQLITTLYNINELLELLCVAGGWSTLLITLLSSFALIGTVGVRLVLGQIGHVTQLLNERVEETVRHRKSVEFLERDYLGGTRPPTAEERIHALSGEDLAKAIAASAMDLEGK